MPAPDLPGRPDRLRRDVTAAAPGMKWAGDIAHGPARRGSAHPAVVVDCSPGKIIGRAIAGRMRAGLVTEAMAAPGPSTDPRCHGPPPRIEELNTRRPNTRNS